MKSVTICGSGKFKEEARKFASDLKKLGVVVYVPHFFNEDKDWENLSLEQSNMIAIGLTHDHFNKIRMGDITFIYNKDGYSGNSTTLEIGYARALGKPIYALAHDTSEICRDVLFQGIITSTRELVKILK